VPRPVRAAAGRPLAGAAGVWNAAGRRLLPGGERPPHFGTKVQKGCAPWRARSLDDIYNSFLDEWSGRALPGAGRRGGARDLRLRHGRRPGAPDAVRMMYCDAVSYLPDDILCKVDRAAMAVSLETRVPFLDHRVAELAARIPSSMKIKGGKGKHILRSCSTARRRSELFERPKAGFGIPVGEWIRGPLRPWAEELLDRSADAQRGLFDADVVHRRWQQHLRGKARFDPGALGGADVPGLAPRARPPPDHATRKGNPPDMKGIILAGGSGTASIRPRCHLEAAAAGLRQADDLLSAVHADAGGHPRDPDHLDAARPAELQRLLGDGSASASRFPMPSRRSRTGWPRPSSSGATSSATDPSR
jgi:hypothetical protein